MSLIEDLNWRHAVKAFNPNEKVSQDKIDKIIEATRLAPTSSGMHPFRVIMVENQELKEKLVAGSLNPDCMKECSHVMVFAGWDNYSEAKVDTVYDNLTDGKGLERGRFDSYTDQLKQIIGNQTPEQNFEHIARQAYIGLGLAMAQCAELRVDSCPVEGFNPKLVDEVLELDKHGLKSICLVYIGVADPKRDWWGHLPKVRIPTEEFVIEYK